MDYEGVLERLGYILSVPKSSHPADTFNRRIEIMAEHAEESIKGLKQLQLENKKLQKITDDLYFVYLNKDNECPHQFEVEAIANYEIFKSIKNKD